ncbi:MAG: GNAT family N-acetyltransferase [Pseudomonadaceae bacterium]
MNMNATVQHDKERKQFYIALDGMRAYLAYMDLGKMTLDIYRTFVPDSLRGKGLAARLTAHALAFAQEQGYTVIPSCSYVERYMDRQAAAVS